MKRDAKVQKRKSLGELSADDIVMACERNYINYWSCVGKSPNAEFYDGDITQCITGVRQDVFNVVLKYNLVGKDIDAVIDEAVAGYRSRRIPLLWHAGLLSEPKDVGRYLEARGFPHDYDLAAMAADLDAVDEFDIPEGTTVKTVASDGDCRQWSECLASSWESPRETVPWMMQNACFNHSLERRLGLSLPRKMYLGSIDGKPASATMLVWDEEIAGLEMVGTVPSAQRRGVGTAVIRAAFADARAMGFKFVVVLSTIEGFRLYEKNGFREFGKLPEHSIDFR